MEPSLISRRPPHGLLYDTTGGADDTDIRPCARLLKSTVAIASRQPMTAVWLRPCLVELA